MGNSSAGRTSDSESECRWFESIFPSQIEVRISDGRGRGLFARELIKQSSVILMDYSRLMSPEDIELFDKTSMSGHWFTHPDKEDHGLLPLGFSGLINHSTNPNAVLTWKDSRLGYVGVLVATRDISKDEEVFIDYEIEMPEDWH